jgi:hypothetical protein
MAAAKPGQSGNPKDSSPRAISYYSFPVISLLLQGACDQCTVATRRLSGIAEPSCSLRSDNDAIDGRHPEARSGQIEIRREHDDVKRG